MAACDSCDTADALLRRCQRDCLEACAKGARVIEMACGTGKTRVIKELAGNISGRVPWPVISGICLRAELRRSYPCLWLFLSWLTYLHPRS